MGENETEEAMKLSPDLYFSTITLFSFLQVSVSTTLAPVHELGVWRVEQTLPPAGAQVAFQLLLIAGVEDTREWSPKEHVWLLFHVDFKWEFCKVSCRFGIVQHFFFGSHPVAAAMMQPPSSWARQQPWLSWLIPKLCPISWAMVAAIPTALLEWSYKERQKKQKVSPIRDVLGNKTTME